MKFKSIIKESVKKSEIDSLIRSYALKIFSVRQNASFKVQSRFQNNFDRIFDKMYTKYGKEYDMKSYKFWDMIKRKANEWWDSQAIKGPGKHW